MLGKAFQGHGKQIPSFLQGIAGSVSLPTCVAGKDTNPLCLNPVEHLQQLQETMLARHAAAVAKQNKETLSPNRCPKDGARDRTLDNLGKRSKMLAGKCVADF